jgi:hypothetical protein
VRTSKGTGRRGRGKLRRTAPNNERKTGGAHDGKSMTSWSALLEMDWVQGEHQSDGKGLNQ